MYAMCSPSGLTVTLPGTTAVGSTFVRGCSLTITRVDVRGTGMSAHEATTSPVNRTRRILDIVLLHSLPVIRAPNGLTHR